MENGVKKSLELDADEVLILENHEWVKNLHWNKNESAFFRATHTFNNRYKDEYYKSLEMFKKS